jgi:hypothetical protein
MKNLGKTFLAASFLLALGFIGCKDDETPTDPGGGIGGLTSAAFPNNTANLAPGGAPAVGAITGGTVPYSINTPPNAAVATAALSGANSDTLTITPVAVGTTSVIIEDSAPSSGDSPSGATLTINITVSEGGGGGGLSGSGTFSVSSSVGNLSASGTFDPNATSGQGVGGARYAGNSPAASDNIEVWGYVARSATDFDIAVALMVYPNGSLMNGTYPFVPTGAGMFGSFALALGVNPNNITENLYVASAGAGVNLTSITSTNAAGNSSGSGYNINNPTATFTFEGATFNVNNYGMGGAPEGPIGIAIEKALAELRKRAAHQ